MPRLTAITIIDKEGRTKASIYYKDGVNQWIPGEQYLLMLRNIGESAPSSSGWWFNKAYDHSASAFVGPHHAQWRRYQTGTKEPEEFGDAVSDAKAQP